MVTPRMVSKFHLNFGFLMSSLGAAINGRVAGMKPYLPGELNLDRPKASANSRPWWFSFGHEIHQF
jgi:hypothetical protein